MVRIREDGLPFSHGPNKRCAPMEETEWRKRDQIMKQAKERIVALWSRGE